MWCKLQGCVVKLNFVFLSRLRVLFSVFLSEFSKAARQQDNLGEHFGSWGTFWTKIYSSLFSDSSKKQARLTPNYWASLVRVLISRHYAGHFHNFISTGHFLASNVTCGQSLITLNCSTVQQNPCPQCDEVVRPRM